MWCIFKKEVRVYFMQGLAYVVLTLFLFISGYFFIAILLSTYQADLRILFGNMSVVLLFIFPFLTMRLLAEEKRLGTDELLFTSPIREYQIVLGKYLACIFFYTIMLIITFEYFIIILMYGSPDTAATLTGYLGIFLLGCCYAAIGIFSSSLTNNQIIAAIITFSILLFFWLIDWLANIIPGSIYSEVFSALSFFKHFHSMHRGIIDITDLFFFLSFIVVALFLTTKVIEMRKW